MLTDDQVVECGQFDGLKLCVVFLKLFTCLVLLSEVVGAVSEVVVTVYLLIQVCCLLEVVLNQVRICLKELGSSGFQSQDMLELILHQHLVEVGRVNRVKQSHPESDAVSFFVVCVLIQLKNLILEVGLPLVDSSCSHIYDSTLLHALDDFDHKARKLIVIKRQFYRISLLLKVEWPCVLWQSLQVLRGVDIVRLIL